MSVSQVYYSPNQSYEDRHYHETPYEVSPPAQRHKQLPEIPTKKAPYLDYYSNSSTYYDNGELPLQQQAPGTKKMLPQIPHSRIRPSPSLPQTYPKFDRRPSVDHQRSSSLDHKDEDDYEYFQTGSRGMVKGQSFGGAYDEDTGGGDVNDDNDDDDDADDRIAVGGPYYADNNHYGVQLQQREKQSYARADSALGATNANSSGEYDAIHRRDVADEKKDEGGGFNRRDTFMKFYQKTVKHLENPRSFFQQQHTDSGESQDEHKQVILLGRSLVVCRAPFGTSAFGMVKRTAWARQRWQRRRQQ